MDEGYVRALAARDVELLSRRALLHRMGAVAATLTVGGGFLAMAGRAGAAERVTGDVGGTLNFLGISGEDGTKVAKPFLQKHHVRLKAQYAVDLDSELTKLATGGTSQFDVLTIPKDTAQRAEQLGFVQPLDVERLPHFTDLFPALRKAPWISDGKHVYGFPLTWGSEPCVYDPKVWKSMPPRYTDFADRKFKGALNTLDEPYGNQWLVARSLRLGERGQYNRLTQAQLNRVRDAWIGIKKNVKAWATTYGDQTDLLVRGETSIALNSWQALLAFAKPKGVTLAYGTPARDGTYYWSDSYFITSHTSNLDTVYAYLQYMTSPASNAKMATTLQSGATMAKAVRLLGANSISKGYDYDLVEKTLNANFRKVILPPKENEGKIVGQAAWNKSWEEVKAS